MSNAEELIARLCDWSDGPDTEKLCLEAADALTALTATIADLTDVLRRNGFVTCDIAACNCGSWHARYGLPERMAEVKEALAEAGHPLCNENGNLVSRSLQALIAERDAQVATIAEQAAQIEALRADAERYRWLRSKNCPWPGVMNYEGHVDSGWYSICEFQLDEAIDDAIKDKT